MNTLNKYENDMDSALLKDKDKRCPSEGTDETKKISPEESEPTYQFLGQSKRSQN